MSGYVIGSLIGAGAVLLGALLTAQRQKRTREAEREAAQRAELKNALREYLAALDALTNELADHPRQPKPTRLDRALDRAASRAGLPVIGFLILRLVHRAVYGQRHHVLSDRIVNAASLLRLIAPPGVEAYMQEAEEVAARWAPGDEAWREEWSVLRARVRAGFRRELDALSAG